MEIWTADKFAYRILVKLFYEVAEENLIQVRSFIVTLLKLVLVNIKKLILSFAWAFLILTLLDMNVDDANECYLMILVLNHAFRKVSYMMNLNKCFNVMLDFFNI